jgi:hypothetical protein
MKVKQYNCIKCSRPVELVFIPGMSSKTFKFFDEMIGAALCRDCLCDKNVPQAAEAVMAQLLN